MSILETRPFRWPDEAACERFAQALARCPQIADLGIELDGGLGAGKTSLVRHLLRAQQVAHQAGLAGPQAAVELDAQVRDLRTAGQRLREALAGGLVGPTEWAGF